jgi:hypothetical protein
MGLDVTLSYCDNWTEKFRLEKEFNDKVEAEGIDWGTTEYSKLSEEMGLDEGFYPTGSIEMNSELYPDHLFKVGYFRSSYNAGGINHILRNRIGKTLYDIFPESEDYYFTPDWDAALARVNDMIVEFNEALDKSRDYNVMQFNSLFLNEEVSSEKDALDVFLAEIGRERAFFDDGSYMNKAGSFFPLPIKVRAVMMGTETSFNKTAAYLITEGDDVDFSWYQHALEIVRETILWVQDQDDASNYGLSWSA